MKIVRDYIIKFLTEMGQMKHPEGKNAEDGVMNMKITTRSELTAEGWWSIIPYMDHTYKLNKLHPYVCRCDNTHLEWTGYRTVCINCFGAVGKPDEYKWEEAASQCYPSWEAYSELLTLEYSPNCSFGNCVGMIIDRPNEGEFIPVLVRHEKSIGGTMIVRPIVPYDEIVWVKADAITITAFDDIVDIYTDYNCFVVNYEGNCIIRSIKGNILDVPPKGEYVLVLTEHNKHMWCKVSSLIMCGEKVEINYD